MQFAPIVALEDAGEMLGAFHCTDGEHLRPFAVHGIQHFVWFDAQLHQSGGELADDKLGEVLFAPHLDIPLHEQSDHRP